MSKLIEILPNVYGVKVPIDASELELICLESMYLRLKTNLEYRNIKLGFGTLENIKLLGTLTKDEISFDTSEVVRKGYYGNYKNYRTTNFSFSNPDESFRSALPEEIFFENPFEEVNKNDYIFEDHPELVGNPKEYDEEKYQNDLQQYQTAQENITQKLLILQKL